MITALSNRSVFRRSKSIVVIILVGFILSASCAHSQRSILDDYIIQAIGQSPEIHQSNLELQKAGISRDFAANYRLPTVGFQLGYQTAHGGRNIDLPIGDMLNGVYSTLNQITGTPSFPMLENQRINFLPSNFYDAKIQTTIPIYNPEVRHNIDLSENKIVAANLDIRIRKRDLAFRVKSAYFDYLMAIEAVKIYRQALSLAQESRRVNERLLKNGKGLPAYVIRSDAEIESISADISGAEMRVQNSASMFNYLLNRPENSPIDTMFDAKVALEAGRLLATLPPDISRREEIKNLQNASVLYKNVIKIHKSAALPRLNGIINVGSQAENWQFDSQSRYFLLGLQLEVPIFSAFKVRQKTAIAQLELGQNESRTEYASRGLSLAAGVAINNLRSALESLDASQKQLEAASTYRRLIEKGYAEGVSTFIETIDARNQWTTAQLAQKIRLYKVLQAVAAVERETASYNIDQ